MQSSRRKRERVENDPADAGTSSRDGSARPTSTRKKLHISQGVEGAVEKMEQEISAGIRQANDAQVSADENGSANAQSSDGGHDHSEEPENLKSMANDGIESQRTTLATPQDTIMSNPLALENGNKEGEADGSGRGDENGEDKIAVLLSHRRLLLDRIRKCRAAAESRQIRNALSKRKRPEPRSEKEDENKTIPNVIESMKADQANILVNPMLGSDEDKLSSDNEEYQEFVDRCQAAIQHAKKQRAEANEAAIEKRVSLSLRRGASVGKRMNAALSTLAPGGSGLSSSASAPRPVPLPQTASVPQSVPLALSTLSGPQHIPIPSPSSKLVVSSAQLLHPVASAKARQGVPIPTPHVQSEVGRSSVQKMKRPIAQKILKSAPSVLSRGNSSVPTSYAQASALPLHTGTGGNGLPYNKLAYISPLFREAHALREHRSSIRSKLSLVLDKRQKRIEHHNLRQSKSNTEVVSLAVISNPNIQPLTMDVSVSPSKLPHRRKTHWDYLLEEMRWLATDFIEERKWKASSARTVSIAVVSNTMNTISSASKVHRHSKKSCTVTIEPKGSGVEQSSSASVRGESDASTNPVVTRCGLREYARPSASDIKSNRANARILSDMISETWNVILESGALAKSDNSHLAALRRHMRLRQVSQGCDPPSSDQKGPVRDLEVEGEREINPKSTRDEDYLTFPLVNSNDNLDPSLATVEYDPPEGEEAALSHEEITKRIHSAADRISSRQVRRNQGDSFSENVALTKQQRCAIDFVERIWQGGDPTGGLLDGQPGSGKTFATCSLLASHRSCGSQLLVCSPARLIRWVHELRRLPGIRVLVFGLSSGICSPVSNDVAGFSYGPGDIVVCEFGSFLRVNEGGEYRSLVPSSFYSVTIDARHPFDSIATNSSQQVGKTNAPTVGKPTGGAVMRSRHRLIPPQLLSRSWWSDMLRSLRAASIRRLLIQNYGLSNLSSMSCAGLEDKQLLDIMAAKFAFVLGPGLFFSEHSPSTQHRVVSWAKNCVKGFVDSRKLKLHEVQRHLDNTVLPFCYSIEATENGFVNGQKSIDWDVWPCSLSSGQRSDYEKCCFEVRGSLSFGSLCSSGRQSMSEPCRLAAMALLRLRQVCVHARMNEILEHGTESFRRMIRSCSLKVHDSETGRSGPFRRHVTRSVSQPDDDLALHIISGSAKFRELLIILRETCGFRIGSKIVDDYLPLDGLPKGRTRAPIAKKVVILASLPEVQLLASVLLNAVGIKHELLVRSSMKEEAVDTYNPLSAQPTLTSSVSEDDSTTDNICLSTLAWIESQLALARFNSTNSPSVDSKANESMPFVTCDVLVASPVTLSPGNGGLDIASADVVICLDEDWSGRDGLLLAQTVSKGHFKADPRYNDTEDSHNCRFIRLICKGTCEENFVFGEGRKVITSESRWSVNALGHYMLPPTLSETKVVWPGNVSGVDEVSRQNMISFPARHILGLRNENLSTVLRMNSPLPVDFATGQPMRFLPHLPVDGAITNSRDRNVLAEIAIVRHLVDVENMSLNLSTALSANDWRGGNRPPSRANILPPSPDKFPDGVVTRHDMMCLPLHVFVDHFAHFLALTEGFSVPPPNSAGQYNRTDHMLPAGPLEGVPVDSADPAETWHKSGLSCKPDDLASSLLTYNTPRVSQKPDELRPADYTSIQGKQDKNRILKNVGLRCNGYVHSYSSSRDGRTNIMKDGNQGCESLVYFPPPFPGLLIAAQAANVEYNHIVATRSEKIGVLTFVDIDGSVDLASNGNLSRKRMDEVDEGGISKRQRVEAEGISDVRPVGHIASPLHASTAMVPLSGMQVAAGVPLEAPCSEHMGIVEGRQEATGTTASFVTEDSSISDEANFVLDRTEDYGLMGIGVLALLDDAVHEASTMDTKASSYASSNDAHGIAPDFYSTRLLCDSEEAGTLPEELQLDSVILFVMKKPTTTTSIGLNSTSLAPGTNSTLHHGVMGTGTYQWTQAAPTLGGTSIAPYSSGISVSNGASVDSKFNAVLGGKKMKKKIVNSNSTAVITVSDYGRVPNQFNVPPMLVTKGNDSNRSKTGFGKHGIGEKLFESLSFRLASIRVRNRVLCRLRRATLMSVTFETGFGRTFAPIEKDRTISAVCVTEPSARKHKWTSAVEKTKSAGMTGDLARSQSMLQRGSMRRSLVSPCRVDFGPFQVGFLASPAGMTGIVPPRSRIGINLPMGVKLPQRSRDPLTQLWTADEDARLTNCALTYGMNWHLAARAVNGLEDSTMHRNRSYPVTDTRPLQRSASQCQERWQTLAKLNTTLAKDIAKLERQLRQNSTSRPVMIQSNALNVRRAVVPLANCIKGGVNTNFDAIDLCEFGEMGDVVSILLPSVLVSDETTSDDVLRLNQNNAKASNPTPLHFESRPDESRPRRSFASFRRAATKSQQFTMTIPGVITGEKAQFVPSHPSHAQTIQAATASSPPSSRTEMWPLQLLDFADKQRVGRQVTQATVVAPAGGAHSVNESQSHRPAVHQPAQQARASNYPQVPQQMVPHSTRPVSSSPPRSSSHRGTTPGGHPSASPPATSSTGALHPPGT